MCMHACTYAYVRAPCFIWFHSIMKTNQQPMFAYIISYSTGGDKQEVLHVYTRTDAWTHGLLAPHCHPSVHTYVYTDTHT